MAKHEKGSKIQRAKLRKANAKRSKARRASKAAKATKQMAARAKPKPAPVKKAARKVKAPVAAVIETGTAAAEMIEQPASVTVTEVEEIRKAS